MLILAKRISMEEDQKNQKIELNLNLNLDGLKAKDGDEGNSFQR